jgi:hypothetical protein
MKKPAWNKGLTKDTDARMAQGALAMRGHKPGKSNENHKGWKGDDVGYGALHVWIHRHWGKADHCENCHVVGAKKYEWSNKGIYDRNPENWVQLCTSCHRLFDYQRSGYVSFRKGKKLGFTPKHAFKKGLIPWNKGKRYTLEEVRKQPPNIILGGALA